MRTVRIWLTRLRHAFLPSDRDDEISEEIESHLQLHIDDNIRAGMTPADARRAARLRLGPVGTLEETYRDRRSIPIVDTIRQDVAYGFRVLTQAPTYTTAAILSLALGIGANTAIFSILDSLLLKPLPVRDPQQLVAIASDEAGQDATLTYPIWQQIRDRGLFDTPFVWASDLLTASDGNEGFPIEAIWADGAFFDVLGTPAAIGRTLSPMDDQRGGGPEGPSAVISDAFWSRRFARDRGAIGRTVVVGDVPYRIVGVTPPSFFGLEVGHSFDMILPLETETLLKRFPSRLTSPSWPWLHIAGRLRPGERLDALTARIRAAQADIKAATMPPYSKPELREAYLRAPWSIRSAATGSSSLRERYAPALFVLLAIVGLVLLIACANIANLQLARTSARHYEFSVRRALGASQGRIAQQQLVESLLLSIAGALLGYLFAQWGCRMVVAQLSTWAATAFLDFSADLRVLGATVLVTVATTLLYGLAPAVRAARAEPLTALKGGPITRGKRTLAASAILGQAALSFALVVASVAFVRSFSALAHRDLGFDRSRVVVGVLDNRLIPSSARVALYERVRDVVAAVPGVESAAISTATPLGNAGVRFTIDALIPETAAVGRNILMNPVSAGWFRTYGTRLIRGRDFGVADNASGAVAIVNEAFARRYFPGADAVGRQLLLKGARSGSERVDIVGVAENAAFTSARDPVPPTLYRPFAQVIDESRAALPSVSISVRAAQGIPPDRLDAAIAAAIAALNPGLKVSFRTLDTYLSVYYIRERLLATVSGFFGALALLLAAVGVFGVTAYSVNERRPELALRLALGATRMKVAALVVRRASALAGAGLLAGGIAAWWGTRFIRNLLFGMDGRDLWTFGAAAFSIAGVMAVAAWLPARKAGRANLATVLRQV